MIIHNHLMKIAYYQHQLTFLLATTTAYQQSSFGITISIQEEGSVASQALTPLSVQLYRFPPKLQHSYCQFLSVSFVPPIVLELDVEI